MPLRSDKNSNKEQIFLVKRFSRNVEWKFEVLHLMQVWDKFYVIGISKYYSIKTQKREKGLKELQMIKKTSRATKYIVLLN